VTADEGAFARDPYGAWHGWAEETSDPLTRYATKANIRNDFMFDRALQKELYVGVPFLVNLQDRLATEPMGAIYERWNEHLGTTDVMCIYMRRRLIEAARRFQNEGVLPANVQHAELDRVRPASVLLDPTDDWITATEAARRVDPAADLAAIPLIGELISAMKQAFWCFLATGIHSDSGRSRRRAVHRFGPGGLFTSLNWRAGCPTGTCPGLGREQG
jgi:hypothetical protein